MRKLITANRFFPITTASKVSYSNRYQNWTKNYWGRVVWTDETSFSLTRTTGKEYHYIPTSDNRPLIYQTNQPEGGTFYHVLELLQK